MLTLKQSLKDYRDFQFEIIISYQNKLNYIFPDKLDLRNKLLPIRNQFNQKSCVAMTATSIKEFFINNNKYLSPQFIYNNRKNQNSHGMSPRDLMKILQKYGCCYESTYPYGIIESPKNISKYIYTEAKQFIINGYARIETIEGLKYALNHIGPCLIAFPIYNYSSKPWIQKLNDEYIDGHTLAVVGYNDYGFILRNSWGINWANYGYTVYPFIEFNNHWEIWTILNNIDFKQQNINQIKCSKKLFIVVLSIIYKFIRNK